MFQDIVEIQVIISRIINLIYANINKKTINKFEVIHIKIHIIGGSGTGKSYLAKTLSKKLNVENFDLDNLMWDNTANSYGAKTPVELRDRYLQEILSNTNWIIEGVYYKWCLQCFEDADVIYMLEIPPRVYKYRIIKRFIKRKVGLEEGKKETFKSLKELLIWTDEYQNIKLKEIKCILEKYNNKVVILKRVKDVKELINNY